MYTMIESEVYFEPYYHVLKVLQDPMFPEHIAMKQYIVDVNVSRYGASNLKLNTPLFRSSPSLLLLTEN